MVQREYFLKIGSYAPKAIFVDITERVTSYKQIWDTIKRTCGFPVPGAQLIHYMSVKNSFDPNGKESFNDHYYNLRELKISSLMKRNSGVKFNGKPLENDEVITPSMENQVVADWLESIGGIKLVKFIGQEYAKELETNSLFDLQEIIGKQEVLQTIIDRMENDEQVKVNRMQTFGKKPSNDRDRKFDRNVKFDKPFQRKVCYFCKELKNGNEKTHDTRDCFLRQKNKPKQAKAYLTMMTKDEDDSSSAEESEDESLAGILQTLNTQ